MIGKSTGRDFFVGWDVGGWNCDKNPASRDALVILDSDATIVGTPWRGNLREQINEASNSDEWIAALFKCCNLVAPTLGSHVVLAIDTPLGFSTAFAQLVTQLKRVDTLGDSSQNSYLFRETERFLFCKGLNPLSPVKDMIGSQATKGMHVLAKFAPEVLRCGVWKGNGSLTAIEAYPSACKSSCRFQSLVQRYGISKQMKPPLKRHASGVDHQDKVDALICALVAWVFKTRSELLEHPNKLVPLSEGWIWVPTDALNPRQKLPECP